MIVFYTKPGLLAKYDLIGSEFVATNEHSLWTSGNNFLYRINLIQELIIFVFSYEILYIRRKLFLLVTLPNE